MIFEFPTLFLCCAYPPKSAGNSKTIEFDRYVGISSDELSLGCIFACSKVQLFIILNLPKMHRMYFPNKLLIQRFWLYFTVHISSVLHIWASSTKAFLLFCDSNNFFSKPVDLTTPSQRYPGAMPKRLGGGAGPLYLGYSGKIQTRYSIQLLLERK